jgi:electron transport complex protein RnfB
MVVQSPDLTGWNAWSPILALQAKNHYQTRKSRILREEKDLLKRQASKAAAKLKKLTLEKPADSKELDRKKAIIQAAMARAKEKLNASSN